MNLGAAFLQASAFAATMPLLAPGTIPRYLRAVLAVALTPMLLNQEPAGVTAAHDWLTVLLSRALVGATFGFAASVLAGGVWAGGALLDNMLSSGILFAAASTANGPFARLYQTGFAAIFFASGACTQLLAHATVMKFSGHVIDWPSGLALLMSESMRASLSLAGPALFTQAITVLLCGLIARIAPQVNGLLLSAPAASVSILTVLAISTIAFWRTLANVAIELARLPDFTR